MKKILEVHDNSLRIVIHKKIIGYLVDIYENGNIEYRLKCVRSKGKSEGVYLYIPINSMRIGAIADFTIEKELVLAKSNGPEITIKY